MLQNLGEVEGAPVVLEVVNKVAPDVLPLQAEEQALVTRKRRRHASAFLEQLFFSLEGWF